MQEEVPSPPQVRPAGGAHPNRRTVDFQELQEEANGRVGHQEKARQRKQPKECGKKRSEEEQNSKFSKKAHLHEDWVS